MATPRLSIQIPPSPTETLASVYKESFGGVTPEFIFFDRSPRKTTIKKCNDIQMCIVFDNLLDEYLKYYASTVKAYDDFVTGNIGSFSVALENSTRAYANLIALKEMLRLFNVRDGYPRKAEFIEVLNDADEIIMRTEKWLQNIRLGLILVAEEAIRPGNVNYFLSKVKILPPRPKSPVARY